ncbi:MAG: HD-GYP domain-containing protein [Armatimonadota bacterium]
MLGKRLDDSFPDLPRVDRTKSESESLLGMLNLPSASLGEPSGHSDRVAAYAEAIGERLDLSKKDLIALRRAAILHDVGKVGISREIVEKLGRLTEREFEIMRLHSTIAIRMLESVPELQDSLPMIKHHHERFDGKGYPDGLKGHEIPLGARIIAIAETFDMLVSDVPWREAMTLDQALVEIQENAGTQFDPMIVDVFLSVVGERKVQLPEDVLADQSESAHKPSHSDAN